MQTPPDIFAREAVYYARIFYVPGRLIYNMGSGILRSVDSRRPFVFWWCRPS